MPRYFFDIEGEPRDDTGFDLPDIDAAQRAVQMSLPHPIGGTGQSMHVPFDHDDGPGRFDRAILSATLSVRIRRPTVDVSRVFVRSARSGNAAARQSKS